MESIRVVTMESAFQGTWQSFVLLEFMWATMQTISACLNYMS